MRKWATAAVTIGTTAITTGLLAVQAPAHAGTDKNPIGRQASTTTDVGSLSPLTDDLRGVLFQRMDENPLGQIAQVNSLMYAQVTEYRQKNLYPDAEGVSHTYTSGQLARALKADSQITALGVHMTLTTDEQAALSNALNLGILEHVELYNGAVLPTAISAPLDGCKSVIYDGGISVYRGGTVTAVDGGIVEVWSGGTVSAVKSGFVDVSHGGILRSVTGGEIYVSGGGTIVLGPGIEVTVDANRVYTSRYDFDNAPLKITDVNGEGFELFAADGTQIQLDPQL
ncbi:MAG: hypothetical protein H0T78_03140 [Longispora sp.]|nr:hypothetical protein [Longispora sp. (in: high G+C Gram-positive bacteria)]